MIREFLKEIYADKFSKWLVTITMLILSLMFLTVAIYVVKESEPPLNFEMITAYDAGINSKNDEFYAYYDVPLTEGEQIYVQSVCNDMDVPYELVISIMYAESRFSKDAVNGNSIGIMQVNTINFEEYSKEFDKLGVWTLESFYQNVNAGVYILSDIIAKAKTDYYKQEFLCNQEMNLNMLLVIYNNGWTGAKKDFFSKGVYKSVYSEEVLEYMYNL